MSTSRRSSVTNICFQPGAALFQNSHCSRLTNFGSKDCPLIKGSLVRSVNARGEFSPSAAYTAAKRRLGPEDLLIGGAGVPARGSRLSINAQCEHLWRARCCRRDSQSSGMRFFCPQTAEAPLAPLRAPKRRLGMTTKTWVLCHIWTPPACKGEER